MKEVKSPRKPLLYYYGIVLLIIFLFNLFIAPLLSENQVVEVDYGTFMDMIEEKRIGIVQVEDTQILFTDSAGTVVYKTGRWRTRRSPSGCTIRVPSSGGSSRNRLRRC